MEQRKTQRILQQISKIKEKQILMIIIENHKGYEKYLQSIVDILPPDYLDVHEPQIHDIIMRYKTLTETNQDLLSEVQHNQDQVEKHQATLQGLVKEKNDIIMVFNSKLGSRQKLLDKLKQETAYAEEELEKRTSLGKERVFIVDCKVLIFMDRCECYPKQN